jgi:hypothetical protein
MPSFRSMRCRVTKPSPARRRLPRLGKSCPQRVRHVLFFRRPPRTGAYMKSRYVQLSCILLFITGVLAASALARSLVLAAYFNTPSKTVLAEYAWSSSRNLFAVNQSSKNRGSISVYDIDAGRESRSSSRACNIPTLSRIMSPVASSGLMDCHRSSYYLKHIQFHLDSNSSRYLCAFSSN